MRRFLTADSPSTIRREANLQGHIPGPHYQDCTTETLSIPARGLSPLAGPATGPPYEDMLQERTTTLHYDDALPNCPTKMIGTHHVQAAGGAKGSTAARPGKAFPVVRSRRATQAPDAGHHSLSFAARRRITDKPTGDQPGRLNPGEPLSDRQVQVTTPRPSQWACHCQRTILELHYGGVSHTTLLV